MTEILKAAVGKPWNADTESLDWAGHWPVVNEDGIIHDVLDADETDADNLSRRGIEYDEAADVYRIRLRS